LRGSAEVRERMSRSQPNRRASNHGAAHFSSYGPNRRRRRQSDLAWPSECNDGHFFPKTGMSARFKKFATSGSGPHERVPYQDAPLHLREARDRQPLWRGGGGMRSRSVRNASKRWARPRKIWRGGSLGLEALQPLEIPQNGPSLLWKCLEKTSLDLEKLAKKPWRQP
jgi:hypothetical protein